jgi:sugar (pentulose or hexulose) kinase
MLPTLTVDVGTTSVKLCVFDAASRLLASERHPTPVAVDPWGTIYDVDRLQMLIVGFIRHLDSSIRRGVERVALTGVGESGGLVRPDLTLASPMILWHDHRGAGLLESLSAAQRTRVYEVTGLPVNANYALSKVAWALRNSPEAGAGTRWLNIAEYLAALMTGERAAEHTLASRTMALDIATGEWSGEIAGFLGVDVGVFPALHSATEGTALDARFAEDAGLGSHVKVHVAGHDHMVGAVGADLRENELLNSTGTTEGLLFSRRNPLLTREAEHRKLANGIGCGGDGFTLFASIPTGGSAFATLQSLFAVDAERLSVEVAQAHERYVAGGFDLARIPLVLPQFRGSPPPDKNARARGVIAGLQSDTEREELLFGCFLGMALQYSDVLALFPDRADTVKVIGPASRNPLWLQVKSDLLGAALSVSGLSEVVSIGAQALASGIRPEWRATGPFDIVADHDRTAALDAWRDSIREQWDHAKGFPS